VGRTTQAEITRETKKNSGTVTHALRVLEDDKVVRKTGRRHNGSDEWAWTAGNGKVHNILEGRAKKAARKRAA
jgi:transcription initiation factor IIE alpha subunit